MLNFSRMVGSRGFLSLYWSSTHSKAERFSSRYSHAFSGTPDSVVRSSSVIVPRDLSARRMARVGTASSRSCRSSRYGSADSNPMCRSSSFWPVSTLVEVRVQGQAGELPQQVHGVFVAVGGIM